MSAWSGRTVVALALLAVAGCTSPRDTIVEQPPVTTIADQPDTTDSSTPASDVAAEPDDDDRNETSLLAAIIGLLGFALLLVFAARWMVRLDDRPDGSQTPPRDPDDGLPSDQMSL